MSLDAGPPAAGAGLGTGAAAEEAEAFLAWVRAAEASLDDVAFSHRVERVEDLCDGAALLDVLASVDAKHFTNPYSASDASDNWVIKIGTLKRLYKLMMQFYADSLSTTPELPSPDLDAIARSASLTDLNALCRLAVGIAVQSDRAGEHIGAIQTLSTQHQHALMMAIDEVIRAIQKGARDSQAANGNAADDATADGADSALGDATADGSGAAGVGGAGERGSGDVVATRKEHEALQRLYAELLESHRTLQANLEDAQAERDELARDLRRTKEEREAEARERADDGGLLKAEVQRLKDELRRSEDHLAEAEAEVEKLGGERSDLTRKMEELQRQAADTARLKDQVDEYKHAADKLQKTENVIEKYKKKLEEGADVRRQLRLLEEQNAELVDKNASLEDEYKRVASFKPLMDSYKTQISELEQKASNLQRDLNTARYEGEQTSARLRASEEERARQKEELELFQERVTELENSGAATKRRAKTNGDASAAAATAGADADAEGPEGLAAANQVGDDDSDDDLDGIGGELDDALSGTTMTDLKIKVRRLGRELEAAKANKADASRLLVLENLLEDAQGMKTRYEADYLREHQAKLKLQSQLDAISAGKTELGDGPEAAYALRLRLNETVEELDQAKRELNELGTRHEQATRELNIAKSDLTLVNKDQIEVLHSLRASVGVEKAELEAETARLKKQLASVSEQNRMQMGQINTLLMEKVDLQSEGIGQREEALRRERNLGELRASLAGKALPKEAEDLITNLQSQASDAERARKASAERLEKAKQFIRQQDRLLKERDAEAASARAAGSDEGLAKAKKHLQRQVEILRRENRLMASAFHELGHRHHRELLENARARGGAALLAVAGLGGIPPSGGTTGAVGVAASGAAHHRPVSWLAQQRRAIAGGLSIPGARRA